MFVYLATLVKDERSPMAKAVVGGELDHSMTEMDKCDGGNVRKMIIKA